ncbi:hypothetical protein V8F20_003318 [Naviculisporaceae sp. PSN 640]
MDALPAVLLVDIMPRLGFQWNSDFGSPRIMEKDGRDAAVRHALARIAGHNGILHRHQALPALEAVFNRLSDLFSDPNLGIRDDEEMLYWLLRVRNEGGIALASAVDDQTWIELVFRIVAANRNYHRKIPTIMKDRDRADLSGFALAVERFRELTKIKWDGHIGYIFFYFQRHKKTEVSYCERDAKESRSEGEKCGELQSAALSRPTPPLTEQEKKEAHWRYQIAHALDHEMEEEEEKDSDDSSDSDDLEEGDEPDGDEQILDMLRYLDNLRTTRAAATVTAEGSQGNTSDEDATAPTSAN